MNVFITGITGSVGHYVYDVLTAEPRYHLYLLVRNPQKLKRDYAGNPNVTIVPGSLETIYRQKALLAQMDYAILIATSWGGYKEPWRQNVYATCRILRALNPNRMKRIIYFSTASILDRDHKPVEKIRTIGTNYIRSKFLMHKIMPKQRLADRVITVFPTWVYGGDKSHPFSHAAVGLEGLKKRIWLAKHFDLDFSFHFIHCQDIAVIVKLLLEQTKTKNEYVLGNQPLTIGQFLSQAAEAFGSSKPWFQFKIPMPIIQFLAWLKGSHTWDKYCLSYRHFQYKTISCAKLNLSSKQDSIAGIVALINA